MEKTTKRYFIISGIILLLAVVIGAFGAHGLKPHLNAKELATYETGVTYQFYHGLALLLICLISHSLKVNLKWVMHLFTIGILFFSFNCYLYAVTGMKFFGIIVPIGGTSFILGWINFIMKMRKYESA